jgi:protein YIPF6
LSRDLLAVWEKMKQVLWPKYLLGGIMQRGGEGMNAAERGESQGFGGDIRGIIGRWPDADGILQGGMSDGLRDWDLW